MISKVKEIKFKTAMYIWVAALFFAAVCIPLLSPRTDEAAHSTPLTSKQAAEQLWNSMTPTQQAETSRRIHDSVTKDSAYLACMTATKRQLLDHDFSEERTARTDRICDLAP